MLFFSAGLAASKLFVSPRLSHCFASSHLGTVRRQTDSGGTNFVLHSSSADDAVAASLRAFDVSATILIPHLVPMPPSYYIFISSFRAVDLLPTWSFMGMLKICRKQQAR